MKSKTATKLDALDWNFSAVDDSELVACCFWEYARESEAMRKAVKIAKTAHAKLGKPTPITVERIPSDEDVCRAFGLLHQTGFPLTFWTGLPFPKSWRDIDKTKCNQWANFCPDKFADAVKRPAFQVTGDLNTAHALYSMAKESHDARTAKSQRLLEIDSGAGAGSAANLKEAAELREKLAKLFSPVTIQGVGGVDSFIAQINWKMFSKPEIKACFNKWVDDYVCPLAKPGERGRGNTIADWRPRIDRLGLLRLRRVQTAEQAIETITKTLPKEKRISEKFRVTSELNRDVKKAGEDFHFLFPFVPETLPCCLMD